MCRNESWNKVNLLYAWSCCWLFVIISSHWSNLLSLKISATLRWWLTSGHCMVKLNRPPPSSSRELEDPHRCKRAWYCHLYYFFPQLDMTYCGQQRRWGGPGVMGGHQWRRHDETGLVCSIWVAVGDIGTWVWVLSCHRGHHFSLSQVKKSRVRCTLLEFTFCSLAMLAEVSGYPDRALFLACFVVHTCERLFKSWWRYVRNVYVTTCSEPPYSHGATAGSSISGPTISQFSWWWWYSASVHRLLDLNDPWLLSTGLSRDMMPKERRWEILTLLRLSSPSSTPLPSSRTFGSWGALQDDTCFPLHWPPRHFEILLWICYGEWWIPLPPSWRFSHLS